MKIAITGNTQGIGKHLYEGFKNQGHEVIGFNRKTPGNLSSDIGINLIVEMSKDCDVFINNAYDVSKITQVEGFAQTTLLYKIWDKWQGLDKKIIVIGSRSSDVVHNKAWPYAIQKKSLDEAVKQLRLVRESKPHILNIKPSYVDTNQISRLTNVKKMDPAYIFDICNWALNQPNLIFDISFGAEQ